MNRVRAPLNTMFLVNLRLMNEVTFFQDRRVSTLRGVAGDENTILDSCEGHRRTHRHRYCCIVLLREGQLILSLSIYNVVLV